jgi:hypothetical protein
MNEPFLVKIMVFNATFNNQIKNSQLYSKGAVTINAYHR